ncbi:MAG: hypothetical protein HY651_11605 [Acidobacteria bacterium]|nr:hypothetical protein [Acidobacteriota bacterium]
MKRNYSSLWPLLFMIVLTSLAIRAQGPQTKSPAAAGQPSIKVEGLITTGLNTAGGCGMPTFTLKTNEGKEYAIHLGTLKASDGTVFTPKMGETIAVTGDPCCGMATQNPSMIHAAEITLAKKIFRAPAGSMPGMMMGQGQMGPGMMMGPGQMPAGPMGPGTMMCPGMTGPGLPGQGPAQGQMAPMGQMGPGAMAPGTMPCCTGTGTTGPTCPACAMQQPPAAPGGGAETK